MDSNVTPVTSNRKMQSLQQPSSKAVFRHSNEATPCLPLNKITLGQIPSENPWSTSETTNSISVTSSSNKPMSMSTLRMERDSTIGTAKQNSNKTKSTYFMRPSSKGPFSVETPFLPNKDSTPLVLATARQSGSTIMTSCNCDSIRHLQNPYSDGIIGITSSESIQMKTKSKTTPKCRETLSSDGRVNSDIQRISESDIRPLRSVTRENSLSSSEAQIYMGVVWHMGKLGVAYYDLDTTIIYVMLDIPETDDFKYLLKVVEEIQPVQIVVSSKQDDRLLRVLHKKAPEICKRRVLSLDLPAVKEHFTEMERVMYLTSLIPFENLSMIRALGGLLKYLEKMRVGIELEEATVRVPVLDVKIVTIESQMILDETAYSALQIFHRESHPSVYKTGTNNGGKEGLSLFGIMNRTKSQIGSKMLRKWFQRPSMDKVTIENRYNAISFFTNPRNTELVSSLEEAVKNVKNISTILKRMMSSQATIGGWQSLYKTFYNASSIKELCQGLPQTIDIFKQVKEKFPDDLHRVTSLINKIVDFQECEVQNRFVVKPHVDENLDKRKRIFSGLPEYLSEVAYQELDKLGDRVTQCSVIYIPQIGYLLAVSETSINISQNEENYPLEMEGLEYVNWTIFLETLDVISLNSILEHTSTLLDVLDVAAQLDCLLSLATCANEYNYVRPTITDYNVIEIIGGRHPIQEMCCHMFVPNDIQSNNDYGRIKILTGPNACGKSVYLKQVPLIIFLAQIGSFVPAESAKIGLVDRIYTRIRSIDSVSVGLSTFMIDINQMSDALRNAGKMSVCIVDEFGKGTESIDGMSLLSSSIKYWLDKGINCPHVFVSTHFHGIIHHNLIPRSPMVKYLTLETLHNGEELVFLYQLIEGHTSSSYACHVASQAGLPDHIVKRGIQVSELINQGKSVQRGDTVDHDCQLKRCETVVKGFLDLDLESANFRSFLSQFVLPTMDGKL
ncbi:MutS protein 5 [Mactra antiquata]